MLIGNYERYCAQYWLVENYEQARKDPLNAWFIHHRKGVEISVHELKKSKHYFNVLPSELMWVTYDMHAHIHQWHTKHKEITEETRLKISIGNKGKSHKHTEETKAKISASMTGMTVSKEVRAKISASLMGNTAPNKGMPMPAKQKERFNKIRNLYYSDNPEHLSWNEFQLKFKGVAI